MTVRSLLTSITRRVLPFAIALIFASACVGIVITPEPAPTGATLPPAPAELTLEDLQSATYRGIYDQPVELTAGKYEGEPFVEGGASRPTVTLTPFHAFGDLNGDGVADAAAVLVESSGGSGSFVYLAAVVNESGQPANVATDLLGDRVQVETISIDAGQVTLETVTHGPDDPMCCPSQEATLVYELQGERLVKVSG